MTFWWCHLKLTCVYRTSKLLHPIKTTIKSKKAWHCLLKYKEKVDLTEKLNIPVKRQLGYCSEIRGNVALTFMWYAPKSARLGPTRLWRTWISAKTGFLLSQWDRIQMSFILLWSRSISISRSLSRRMSLQLSLPGPIWRQMQTLLGTQRVTGAYTHTKPACAWKKSKRFILISLNFTTDVKQHHKTRDHETHQRTTERGLRRMEAA